MGNRVEDGNRAKNWVVQTSSIRGPVFIFAQRMPSLSFSLFCSPVSRGFAFVPRTCALLFFSHPLSSTSFLSATLRKSYFSVSVSWFLFLRRGGWSLTCFFFSSYSSSSSSFPERGFVYLLKATDRVPCWMVLRFT